jgi:glycogen synthase
MVLSPHQVNSTVDLNVNKGQQRPAQEPRQRILYALGPGDAVGLFRDLMEAREPAFQPGMPFSKQFLDWCDESRVQAHLMSWHPRRDCIQIGPHWVENRPKPSWYFGGGLKYHVASLSYGVAVVTQAFKERASVVIVDTGTTQWMVLSLLSILRIPVIAVMHNALWPMGVPPTRFMNKFFAAMDGLFFRRIAAATVCVSPECERQVRTVAKTAKGPVYQCRAQYREDFFKRVNPVSPPPFHPFRVLFLGRIEESKGVFLILSMAERLEKELPGQFAWKIVGSGQASEALERQVGERKLGRIVEVAGRLPNEQKALETFGWAHAMVVPTTSHFSEGLPMVAIEAALAGRPVVVSAATCAWDALGDAAIRAETNNVGSFVETFRRLAQDPAYYDECQRATLAAQAQFYDRTLGLGAMLGRAISALA